MLLAVLSAVLAGAATAGVFGDGEPGNGPEDDRRGLSQGVGGGHGHDWYRSAGVVHCDGAIRGSATLLDLDALTPAPSGRVIATAAHVLFDLDAGRPWQRCDFHYMALGQLPGYTAELRTDWTLKGDFDPVADPSAAGSGRGDWALVWLGPEWRAPEGARGLAPLPVARVADGQGDLGLIAWNRSRGEISVTTGCRAVLSSKQDIGGGAWPGQLLDDCDSDAGASGGALVTHRDGADWLIAIRGGAHWDRERWPADRWPEGPPPGGRWDIQAHTNYARAIDPDLVAQVSAWLTSLSDHPANPAPGNSDAP